MRFKCSSALVLLGSVGLLAVLLHRAEMKAVAAQLGRVPVGVLVPMLALDALCHLAKTLRWHVLLAPFATVKLRHILGGIMLGATSNTLLPLRIDELVRTGYVSRKSRIAAPTVLGTVAADRLLEVFVLACVSGVLVAILPEIDLVRRSAVGAAVLLAVACTLIVGARLVAARERRRPGKRLSAWRGYLAGFARGASALPRDRRLIGLLALASSEWCVLALLTTLGLAVFELQVAPSGLLLVLVAHYASFALPAGPGSIGVFEFLVVSALGVATEAPLDARMGFALFYHAVLVVPSTLVGVAFLAGEGMRFGPLPTAGSDTWMGSHETPAV